MLKLRLLLFSFTCFLVGCKSQPNKSSKDSMASSLMHHYNKGNYDSIFLMFSPEMQKALPLNEVKPFFENKKSVDGKLTNYSFIENKDSYNRYRADFSRGIYWMSILPTKDGKIAGLYFREYDGPGITALMERNKSKMSLPFSGEWFVFWGGDTKEQNYHVSSRSQKNAFDLVMVNEKGRSFKTNGRTNDDYYVFGQPLLAVCDAVVVSTIDGVKENIPGQMNPGQLTGNTVLLKTGANEYILYAHFKLNSIKVKAGEKVIKGQVLGLCGNSGNSSEPHLHFHIQDKEFMSGSTGVKSYFEKIKVNGVLKNDYSPVRGEKIQNAN